MCRTHLKAGCVSSYTFLLYTAMRVQGCTRSEAAPRMARLSGSVHIHIYMESIRNNQFLVSETLSAAALPYLISSVRQLICSLVHSAVILHYHLNPLTRYISATTMPTQPQALYSLPSHHHPVLHCRLQGQLQD